MACEKFLKMSFSDIKIVSFLNSIDALGVDDSLH